jgi:hypothetical protein
MAAAIAVLARISGVLTRLVTVALVLVGAIVAVQSGHTLARQ